MTSATSDTSTGVGQHYWTVTLTAPSGASAALQQFVTMGQDAIQTAVDLLGRGASDLPPVTDDLLQTVTYQDLGSGTANSSYQSLLSEIESRQTSLLSTDNQVMQASITVSASTDTTLQYIETIVSDLQSEFTSITGTLTAAQNTALMQQIGDAVDMVNARVTSVYEANQGIAGTSSSNSSDTSTSTDGATGASTSSTGSSGSDSLSSLLSILPMLAMPLMQLAPELLKDLTKGNQPGASGAAQAGAGQPTAGQPANNAQFAVGGPTGAGQSTTTTAPANAGQPAAATTTAPAAANSPTTQNQSTPQN